MVFSGQVKTGTVDGITVFCKKIPWVQLFPAVLAFPAVRKLPAALMFPVALAFPAALTFPALKVSQQEQWAPAELHHLIRDCQNFRPGFLRYWHRSIFHRYPAASQLWNCRNRNGSDNNSNVPQ